MKNDIARVPYIGVEFERYRSKRIIRLLAVFLAVAVFGVVISNAAWKIIYDKATRGEGIREEAPAIIYSIQNGLNPITGRKMRCGKVLKNMSYHGVSG